MEKYEFTVSKVSKKDNGYNVEGPNGYGCTLGDEHLKGKKVKVGDNLTAYCSNYGTILGLELNGEKIF